MRVYFDASVIIAALLSDSGGSALSIRYINLGVIDGITSQTVVDEVLKHTTLRKINTSSEVVERFIRESNLIVRKGVTAKEIASYRKRVDVEDAHVVAGAKLTRCTRLVTLDKRHLLREDIRRRFLPLLIVSPKELLQEIVLG